MAKKQVATVEVFCNAKQAVQILNEYKRLAADTLSKIEQKTQRVNQIRAKGANATKAEVAEMKRLSQELKKDEQAFRMYNSAVQKGIDSHVKLRNVMKDLSGSKLKDLKMALRELQKMMNNVSNDTPKRAAVIKNSIQKVQAQITKLTGETGKFGKTHSSVWQTAVRNITAYVGVFGAFNMIINKLKQLTTLNLAFSDSLANVRKVSNLPIEDINRLAVNLSKIDTRTPLSTLVGDLAYAGAKLGFGEKGGIEALESYVKAANKVNVALGEELGSEAMPVLSKITENMGLIDKMGVEQAILKTGSAMFKLSNTSTAAAGPIVEFSKRLLSVGKTAGLTTEQILAFGSAMDSTMQSPEVAATAIGKLMVAIQRNHNLIENTLGMAKGSISELYQKGEMVQVLLNIFEKMREKGGINQLGPIFKLLGSDGQRLVTVLVTMSAQLPLLKAHLETAKRAFEEGTAITKEYNIQQQTAAGIMERANNMWTKAFVNPEGVDTVKDMAKAWYDLSKELTTSEGFMVSARLAISALVTAFKALLTLSPALIIAAATRGFMALIFSVTAAKGAVDGLTLSFSKLSKASKANVIALGLGLALEGLIFLMTKLKGKTDEMTRSTNILTAAEKEASETSARQRGELKRLYDTSQDLTKSTKERTDAVMQMQMKYPAYFGNLTTEEILAGKAADAYSRLKDEIINTAKARAYQKKIDELVEENVVLEDQNEQNMNWMDENREKYERERKKADAAVNAQNRLETSGASMVGGKMGYLRASNKADKALIGAFQGREQENAANNRKIEENNAAIKRIEKKLNTVSPNGTGAKEDADNALLALENEAPDKEALKAANAAAAERRRQEAQARRERLQQLRNELKDAEQEAQAIIDKINEFYYLQEETIEQQVADGKITRAIADQYLKELKLSKNQTLANARKSIVGKMTKDDWDKYVKAELVRVMVDQGEWSSELAGEIINTDLTYIHNLLAKFNGSEAVLGLRSTASFDKLMKNAAVNERDNAKIRAQIAEEVEKVLAEYNYVEQAQKSFHGNLIALGIMRETYEQYAKRMQEEAKALAQKDGQAAGDVAWDLSLPNVSVSGKYKSPEEQLLQQFLSQGSKPYRVNPQNDRNLYVWLQNLMSNYDYDEEDNIRYHTEGWVQKGFPQLEEWVKDIDKYRPEIQKFYFSLITWEDEYYDAKKKAYDRSKRLMQQEWERSGNKQRYDDLELELNKRGRERKMPGYDQGETFGQMGGFTALEEDPELAAYQAKIEASQLYLLQLQQEHADELLIREAQRAENEAELAYQEQIMAKIDERINKLHEWTDPIEQFGSDVGTALGESLRSGESMAEGMEEALRKVALAWGQTTIKIIEELMMQRVKQKLLNKAMQHEETAHQTTMAAIEQSGAASRQAIAEATGTAKVVTEQVTNATIEGEQVAHNATTLAEDTSMATSENAVNTSRAAGKTLADLGWWGIPLVAVIVALLNMLLQAALGKGSKKSNNANTKINTKLVSGMLTYDEGNVSSYVGTDGHVYNARRTAMPQGTALVTSPIATTINGQPSLVAERGPEIVIGRRTTRHIMLNEPALLQHLANLDRHRTAARYRPYDDGNIESLFSVGSGSAVAQSQQSGTDEQTRQTLEALTAAVIALQARLAQPIEAKINKYGSGGLIDEVQSGLKFMNRYTG